MSRRIKTAEQSARRESEVAKVTLRTLVADSTAPADLRGRRDHYRRYLADAHLTIEVLQLRIKELEHERDAIRADRDYKLSLCVTRREAEEGRISAFGLARRKAAMLAEFPDDVPNNLSEAIDKIPNPKPKWTT